MAYVYATINQMDFIFTGRMSEGDSAGESIHGKPSVVTAFFTGIGQVICLLLRSSNFPTVINNVLLKCTDFTHMGNALQ